MNAYLRWAKPSKFKCMFLGCSRRTTNQHGFCFQHEYIILDIKERADEERAARAVTLRNNHDRL